MAGTGADALRASLLGGVACQGADARRASVIGGSDGVADERRDSLGMLCMVALRCDVVGAAASWNAGGMTLPMMESLLVG